MLTINRTVASSISLSDTVAFDLLQEAFRKLARKNPANPEGSTNKGPLTFEVLRKTQRAHFEDQLLLLKLENTTAPVYSVTMRFKGDFVCKAEFTEQDA